MSRLEREVISRLAMMVIAALLAVAGGALIYLSEWIVRPAETNSARPYTSHYTISVRLIALGIGLIVAGICLLVASFRRSVNTEREPTDPKYRIK